MTIESARAFYRKVSQDNFFRISLEAVSTKEERNQLIKDAGYDFTCKEW